MQGCIEIEVLDSTSNRFSHRSLLAFVFARYLVRCARLGAETLRSALATERLDTTCTSLFVEIAARYPAVQRVVRQVLEGPYLADATENAVRLAAAFEARTV